MRAYRLFFLFVISLLGSFVVFRFVLARSQYRPCQMTCRRFLRTEKDLERMEEGENLARLAGEESSSCRIYTQAHTTETGT